MIEEIKIMIQNYLNNAKLCSLLVGTVESSGIRTNEKIVIPSELIKGNLKEYTSSGDSVRLIRNHGGKEFYIVEIIGKEFIAKGNKVTLSRDGSSYEYIVEDVVK